MDISPKSDRSDDALSGDSDFAAPTAVEIAEPRLRLVDPVADFDNMWITLHEGCVTVCIQWLP